MKTRNLIVLAVIVILVGAFIAFYERHQPTSEQARERADKVFPQLERDTVTGVEIHNSHGDFRLSKSGDGWRLEEPIAFPADTPTVSSLINSLVNLKEERRLAAGEVDPAAYGLDAPALKVAVSTSDGERFSVEVGDKTALGSNRAVRRSGDDAIVLVPGWFVSDLDKDLSAWRSRDVVDVTADKVASIQVVSGADRIHAVRDRDQWRLLEPVADLADRDQLRNLISNLASLRVQEFVDQEPDLAAMGLAEPQYRITLVRTEGTAPVQLDFGGTRDKDGAAQVACRRDGADTFWVNDVAATALARAPVRWRSPKVYGFDTWDADRLVISSGGTEVRLDRAEGMWKLADGAEVDYGAVQDRLSTLANLEAIEFDLLAPVTAELGRVELTLKASATGDDGEPDAVSYVFHRPLAEGGEVAVTVSTRTTVMSVDPDQADQILGSLDGLRKQPQGAEDAGGE